MKLSQLIKTIFALSLCLCLSLIFVGCGEEEINAAVDAAKGDLEATIAELNGQLDTLSQQIAEKEGKIATLEGEIKTLTEENKQHDTDLATTKAELEAVRLEREALIAELDEVVAEVNCANGIHIPDPEAEVTYETYATENGDYCCRATTLCVRGCTIYEDKMAVENEDGSYTATFDVVPPHTYFPPVITSMHIDLDTPAYDPVYVRYTISEEHPLVVTFKGERLTNLTNYGYGVFFIDENYYYHPIPIHSLNCVEIVDDETLVWTLDLTGYEEMMAVYPINPIQGLGITKAGGRSADENTYELLRIFLTPEATPVVEVGTEEEYKTAMTEGGNIRLTADIVVHEVLYLSNDIILDLNGFSLTIDDPDGWKSMTIYRELTLMSSIPGGILYGGIDAAYAERITILADVELVDDEGDYVIFTSSILDLSEYNGSGIKIYTHEMTELILGEGYACYDGKGNLLTTVEEMNAAHYLTVRPQDG